MLHIHLMRTRVTRPCVKEDLRLGIEVLRVCEASGNKVRAGGRGMQIGNEGGC